MPERSCTASMCEEAVAMRETTAAYHARAAMRERGDAPVTVAGTVETLSTGGVQGGDVEGRSH